MKRDRMNLNTHADLNGQAPRCEHLRELPNQIERSAPECQECLAHGLAWKRLLLCLTCGWVACSDDSTGQHAAEHYKETDHPVFAALGSPRRWRWCYIHERTV